MKSTPSLPLVMPIHIALKVSIGDGSSTGSTTRAHTVSDHTASSTATPTNGNNISRRFMPCSSLAYLALEDFEAVRLGADEVGFRQGLVGERARRVVVDEFHGTGRMARQQQNPVRQIYRLLQVMRDQHRGGRGLDEDALHLLAHEQRHLVIECRERLVEKQDFR